MDYVLRFCKGILKNPRNFLKLPITMLLSLITIVTSSFGMPAPALNVSHSGGTQSDYYDVGFGKCEIMPESLTDAKGNYLYHLAGFDNETLATEIADPLYARSVWVDDKSGTGGIALVSVDCIGLVYADTTEVKNRLADWCAQTGCRGIEIMSTHCHEAIDTLGYWGDLYSLSSGRDKGYMEIVFNGIINAVKSSYLNRREGTLTYGSISAGDGRLQMDDGSYFSMFLADSRDPSFYKEDLTRIRFVPKDTNSPEIHIFNYSAHPEVFRLNYRYSPDKGLLTADYVAYLCARDKELTGADSIVFAGAIGGLIAIYGYECDENGNGMSFEKLYAPFVQELFDKGITDMAGLMENARKIYFEYYTNDDEWTALTDAEKKEAAYYCSPEFAPERWDELSNAYFERQDSYARELMVKTGYWLAEQSLLIENEKPVSVSLGIATVQTDIPVQNTVFRLASIGGIMAGKGHLGFVDGKLKLLERTEVSCLNLGGLKIALVPGEIFPELAYNGCEFTALNPDKQNPETLSSIADDENLLVFGLANDEIGYIVTPETFLLDKKLPYIREGWDASYSGHYEETMSMGPDTATHVAGAFEKAVNALDAAQ